MALRIVLPQAARMAVLTWRNVVSRRPVHDPASAVDVSLTTYGQRTAFVYQTLESIARGRVRPRRLYLWVDEALAADPPRTLVRLQRRGLRLRVTPDHGPFKKFYPYVTGEWDGQVPLVTADDDTVYPRWWLAELVRAHARHPGDAIAYRAHRMQVENSQITSYGSWLPQTDPDASFATFGTGVSGILYPPRALAALAAGGDGFTEACPHADDIWIHWTLVRAGIRERLVPGRDGEFPWLPRSQEVALWRTNLVNGRNDSYIAALYGPDLVERISGSAPASPGTAGG
jgi:hypothetical protein